MADDKKSVIDTDLDSKVSTFSEGVKQNKLNDPEADFAPTPPKDEGWKSKGPFVKYTGQATLRSITTEEFEAAGAKGQDYAEWNSLNDKKIPVSHFNENALTYLLQVDGRFEKVDD